MPQLMAFCSACDRPVPVAIKPGARPHPRPAPQDAEDLICLDYRVRCTGALCPLFSVPDDDDSRSGARSRVRPIDPPGVQ